MNFYEALVLGLLQGLTEFIPISSSGHLVLAHAFFGKSTADLSFDAVLQLASALAVIIFFRKEIARLAVSLLRLTVGKAVENEDKTLLLSILIGTVPIVFMGLLLEEKMETVFRSAKLVATMLFTGSILMWFADKRGERKSKLSVRKGFFVGLVQCLALLPGFSRSGATISGGLIAGLGRVDAARFSFLLSVPIIAGSGLKKLLELSGSGYLEAMWPLIFLGFTASLIASLFSIKFLLMFLQKNTLKPFVFYRIVLAVLIFLFL